MSRDFEDEDTLEFVRTDCGDDELALESVESWFWSDDDGEATAALSSSAGA